MTKEEFDLNEYQETDIVFDAWLTDVTDLINESGLLVDVNENVSLLQELHEDGMTTLEAATYMLREFGE